MKDLDFDELDRAVNSLMAGVSKAPPSQDQLPEKTVEISSSPDVSVRQHPRSEGVSASLSVGRGDQNKNKMPPNAPSTRRGGRFMDVVHSPSAMKRAEVPSTSVSRQAATIEPAKPIVSTVSELESDTSPRSETLSSSSMPTPTSMSSITPAQETSISSLSKPGDWPDPLDMAGFDNEKKSTEENKSAPKLETTVPPVDRQSVETSEPPLTSPFLADTKVDKRPLGGSTAATVSANETNNIPSLLTSDGTESAEEQLPATLEDTKPILPAELHNDLMAIESDTTEPARAIEKPSEQQSPDADVRSETKEPIVEAKREPTVLEQQPTPVPSGPVSIPQQYKEEPSSLESKSGAIYDTDTYHQPLAHPAKAKSGWMWVIWIILILLLGAGVGAALFFLGVV